VHQFRHLLGGQTKKLEAKGEEKMNKKFEPEFIVDCGGAISVVDSGTKGGEG